MSEQKYFYRGWDMVRLISSEFNLIITSIFALVGLLCFFITPSYSLGWQDEEWLKPGCPKTVSGNWAVDNLAKKKREILVKFSGVGSFSGFQSLLPKQKRKLGNRDFPSYFKNSQSLARWPISFL